MNSIEFEKVLLSFRTHLEPQAMRLTRNRELAQDLLQDTLLKAVLNRKKFRKGGSGKLKAWLFTIMKNTYLTHCRSITNRRRLLSQAGDLPGISPASQMGTNMGDAGLVSEEIEKAMDKVRYEHLTPFMMHHNGYSYQEIADILDQPLGTVKSQIYQARKQLQFSLKDFNDKQVSVAYS